MLPSNTSTSDSMTDNWRNTAIKALADKPEEWRPLGAVFSDVVDVIPLHTALRAAADTARQHARAKGIELVTVNAHDLDVFKAKWLLFTGWILPLLERRDAGYRKPSGPGEYVRLKPSGTCDGCGGNTYLTGWHGTGKRGNTRNARQIACPHCAPVSAVPRETVALPPMKPKLTIVPKPKRPYRRRGPAPVTPKPLLTVVPKPEPPLVTPTPWPEPIEPDPIIQTLKPLSEMNSLQELWDEFRTTTEGVPSFYKNDKLYKKTRHAFVAGIVDEYTFLMEYRDSELGHLGAMRHLASKPDHYMINPERMKHVWRQRAGLWIDKNTNSRYQRYHNILLTEAYGQGSLAVFSFYCRERLHVIEAEILHAKESLNPKPKQQPQQPQKSWGAMRKAGKKVVSWLGIK